jgi:flagellar protein FliO/FliZ
MGLCVPFLLISQEASSARSDDPGAGVTEPVAGEARVDESTLVLGAPRSESSEQNVGVSPFGFWDLVRMVLVLGCVVAIIYAVFYLLKRAGNGKLNQSGMIRIVGSQALPGNRAIYLVQVGGQVFMVGAGGESVTLLGEITERETVDSLILAAGEADTAPKRNFGEILSSLVSGNQAPSLDLMRQQRERLQRLRQ